MFGELGVFDSSGDYQDWCRVRCRGEVSMTTSRQVVPGPDNVRRRGTLLIVDHDLPMPDQDAGSRVMRCFVDLFIGAGFDVKFWSDRVWPEESYADALRQSGVEVLYGRDYVGRFGQWLAETQVDYVLLSRPLIARSYISLVRHYSKAKILYYGHDIHYLRMEAEASLKKNLVIKGTSLVMRHIETGLWREADVIYYPSESEAKAVIECLPDAIVRAVPLVFYEQGRGPDYSQEALSRKTGLIFVGGFKHEPNVDAVRWFVTDILPLVKKIRPDVILTVVGSNATPEVMALASDSVSVAGYLSDEELRDLYEKSRVAVVPLRFGAGVKGKVVEAMHFGVPVVATSVGLQGLSALESFMPAADIAADFAEQILVLLADDDSWRERGYAALRHVEDNFSLSAMQRILAMDVGMLN